MRGRSRALNAFRCQQEMLSFIFEATTPPTSCTLYLPPIQQLSPNRVTFPIDTLP